jgi:antitoxin (DNA-binding transcriptional repressor) of toxin-antitoxin stability system
MKTVNTHEAKTHFSRLLKRVELGEHVKIARRGKVIARIVPDGEKAAERRLGGLAGKFAVPDDFDAPLPKELLDAFKGNPKRGRKRA